MTLTRRDFGRNVLAGVAATTLVGSGACGSEGSAGTGGSGGANACTVYPQQTAGPFYLDLDQLRSDITEGKLGTSLRLVVQVQSEACAPLKDLAVDLWHCDADGVYSGFAEATSQLYFPENVSAEIYATPPYDARGQKDTPNDLDGVTGGALPPLAMVTDDATAGYVATIVVTVTSG
jgi:hypothetical protein